MPLILVVDGSGPFHANIRKDELEAPAVDAQEPDTAQQAIRDNLPATGPRGGHAVQEACRCKCGNMTDHYPITIL